MTDETTRDILARLEAAEARLATYEAAGTRRTTRRARRTPRWLGRGRGRLGAVLVVALLLASVPISLLATDRFPDVPTANPHHDDVNQIAAAGITIGFPDGTYKPDAFVTRGQMASFLARTAGLGGRTPVANAATALAATTATTVVDGAITTAKLADGAVTPAKIGSEGAAAGQVLTANGSGGASFQALPPPPAGTSANTPDTLVRRDGSGNFAAGTITANLNGNATSATNATNAANADAFDGKSANELVRLTRSAGGFTSVTLTGAGYQTVASVPITVPAAGFVLITSSTFIESGDGIYQVRLRDVNTGAVTAQLVVDITPENNSSTVVF